MMIILVTTTFDLNAPCAWRSDLPGDTDISKNIPCIFEARLNCNCSINACKTYYGICLKDFSLFFSDGGGLPFCSDSHQKPPRYNFTGTGYWCGDNSKSFTKSLASWHLLGVIGMVLNFSSK